MLENRIPFVGEIVLFTPNTSDTVAKSNFNEDPIPAIITRVWSDICVNLKIIPDHGPMQDRGSVVHSSQNPANYHFNFIEKSSNRAVEVKPTKSIEGLQMTSNVESALVSFGNFLLKKYAVSDSIGEPAGVTHADIENWKIEML